MSRTNIAVIAGMVAIVLVVGYIAYLSIEARQNAGELSLSEQLQPDGSLPYTDLNGIPVDLSEYEDRPLVINAWATWCPFCVDELPDLNIVAEEFADAGLVVLAINRAETPDSVRAYIDKMLGNPASITFLLDKGDVFYRSVQGFAMPETVFYRRDGSVSYHKRGAMTPDEMRQRMADAVNPPQ